MRLPLLWRRSATAAGTYVSVVFGFLGTLVAARELGPHAFGLFAIVVAATSFFQTLLDLTAEEALVKYGYRYVTGRQWGKLRRLFRKAFELKLIGGVLAAAAMLIAAPFADSLFGGRNLQTPMLLAALIPLVQSPEGVASSALMVRGRYDLRAAYLAFSMALRLAGLAAGAHYGVTEAVVGLVSAQTVATVSLGGAGILAFRRFPARAHEALGAERRRAPDPVGRGGTAPDRLVEVVSRLDRPARAADSRARDRDRGPDPARARARPDLGRDRCGGRGARGQRGVQRRLGRACRAHR